MLPRTKVSADMRKLSLLAIAGGLLLGSVLAKVIEWKASERIAAR